MLTDPCLALLLDGPMQSWGHSSRFDRRTTALHPTRSGILGLVAAAMGVNKHAPDELRELERFRPLGLTTVAVPRRRGGRPLSMQRLEDYHTVTGIRRASGKVDQEATVLSYRHYLLDARFGVLLEGPRELLQNAAAALRNPRWGIWLGRKCCLPAAPVLVGEVCDRASAFRALLQRAGYSGEETLSQFDHVIEVSPEDPDADRIEDSPLGYGRPVGERHAGRWIRRVPRKAGAEPDVAT